MTEAFAPRTMKWLTRGEWRDRFVEVYGDHLLPACDRTDLDVEESISILGDLLTRDSNTKAIWSMTL